MPRRHDVTTNPQRIRDAIEDLRTTYKEMPETVGCMEHINKPLSEGGCGGWCCSVQSPQLLYIEFINAWGRVVSEWTEEQTQALIERAIRNYLSKNVTKGCVFWDKDTKLCTIHEARPFACHQYGVMPESEWKPRYEQLKVIYPNADLRPQCGLVETESGLPVTKEQSDRWWGMIQDIEAYIGISKEKQSDRAFGSYRTFHDHIMLQLFTEKILVKLTKMRLRATDEEKEAFILVLIKMIKEQEELDAKREEQQKKHRATD